MRQRSAVSTQRELLASGAWIAKMSANKVQGYRAEACFFLRSPV